MEEAISPLRMDCGVCLRYESRLRLQIEVEVLGFDAGALGISYGRREQYASSCLKFESALASFPGRHRASFYLCQRIHTLIAPGIDNALGHTWCPSLMNAPAEQRRSPTGCRQRPVADKPGFSRFSFASSQPGTSEREGYYEAADSCLRRHRFCRDGRCRRHVAKRSKGLGAGTAKDDNFISSFCREYEVHATACP